MSLRTALTIILSALVTALVIYFVLHNDAILREPLNLFSYSFSVISALVAGMLIASAVPSAYFSVQWFKASRKLKRNDKSMVKMVKGDREWKRISGLLAHGHIELAVKLLEKCPEDGQASHQLIRAQVFMENDQFSEVIRILEPDFQKEPLPEEGYLLAEAYRMSGNEERAKVVLETLTNRFPEDSLQALDLLIEEALDHEKWEEVLQWAQKRQALPGGKSPELKELVCGARYELFKEEKGKRDKKSVGALLKFSGEYSDFVPAYKLLSEAYLEIGQENKALKILEKGLNQTGHEVFLRELVAFYLNKEQPEEAIRKLKHVSIQDHKVLASFELARLYYKLAMYKDSIEVLEGLKGMFRNPALYEYLLAQNETKVHNDRKAMEHYQKAFSRDEQGAVIFGETVCDFCGNLTEDWNDHCEECGSWNTLRLNLEPLAAKDLQGPPISYGD
jgi:tetratricopeptide (TPR) repeat protein